jgi:glycosyltransferase involved in cell wall biosynthesis
MTIVPIPAGKSSYGSLLNTNFVTGVNLRKNAGQYNAIMAGLNMAIGEVVVIMDDDLQHDPSDIVPLYNQVKCGFDVVYARFETNSRLSGRLSAVGSTIGLPY